MRSMRQRIKRNLRKGQKMKQNIDRFSKTGSKALALITMGTLVCGAGVMPASASAAQTGSGDTSLTIQLDPNANRELGGTSDANNPDANNDGLGDNLAFTVPVEINFTSNAAGMLTGPSAEATYIENESVMQMYVSSVRVGAADGWSIVEDATHSDNANAISVDFGPTQDTLHAANYLSKAPVGDATKWQMAAASSEGASDRVQIESTGAVRNLDKQINEKTAFGTIAWYVMPGRAV